jgi:divalent metal cation (Fe/Co/Zn/Cd) transporter
MRLSWVVNWLLLGLKIAAYVVSRSKAVLASLADSGGADPAPPSST